MLFTIYPLTYKAHGDGATMSLGVNAITVDPNTGTVYMTEGGFGAGYLLAYTFATR
jgi:hypothetical protein